MKARSLETFETFHSRSPQPVHPFERESSDEWDFDCYIPDLVCVGKAVRVLYQSDKWHKVGDVIGYYHDHGPEDGDHVFSGENQVKLYAPVDFFPDLKPLKRMPVRWPDELVLLGACGGWYAQPKKAPKGGKLFEGVCNNNALFCSPYGWVSKSDPKRIFLAVIEEDTGIVECVIAGPGLRLTKDGIEG